MTPYPKHKRIKLTGKAYADLVQAVRVRDKFTCQLCWHVFPKNMLTGHHIRSRGAGGDDAIDNMVCLCHSCHMRLHGGEIKLSVPPFLNG